MTAPAMHPGTGPRLDAVAKATGVAVFSADLPAPGALELVLARSTFPHAEIRGVRADEARALPGVVAVVTSDDLPPSVASALAGRRVRDMPLLARGVTRFVGEPIAAVLATTRSGAEAAAALVEVDYRELRPILDPLEALAPGADLVHAAAPEYPGAVVRPSDGPNLQSVVVDGSRELVEEALAGAAHVVEATYRTPSGHQGYLEPQAWVAVPGAKGTTRLWGTAKAPYRLRDQILAALGLPPGSVSVEPVLIGGDFGGKGGVVDAALCVALCRLLEQPVRLVLRSPEDLTATDARHPGVMTARLGCDASGHLAGLDFDAVFDGGAYAAAKPIPSVNLHGALDCALGYRLPCFAMRSRIAYTNTVPKGHMRAPGAPQTVFAVESAMDELAALAGISPVELRRRNLLDDDEPDAYGHRWPEARGVATLEAAIDAAGHPGSAGGLEGKPGRPGAPDGWSLGTGVAVYARPTPASPATSVGLSPLPDGRLEVSVPIPETGTGSHSVVREELSKALGVDPDMIVVRQVSTGSLPPDPGVGASRVTVGVSSAVAAVAAEWRAIGGRETVTVEVPAGPDPPALSYCAQVANVAVDPQTGQVRVVDLVTAVDVATVIRPRAHQLQIHGGSVKGYGFAFLEDLGESDGQVWASNLGEFRIPTAADVPTLRTVLVPGGRGVGPAGVKAIGELTNVAVAAALANAIADATGVRVRALPITAEQVFWALREEPGCA
ncbi:MAG: xanthine dehydrogenase family protein molybdopterin-binding subunit [Acidimicrobiales bacterium]